MGYPTPHMQTKNKFEDLFELWTALTKTHGLNVHECSDISKNYLLLAKENSIHKQYSAKKVVSLSNKNKRRRRRKEDDDES